MSERSDDNRQHQVRQMLLWIASRCSVTLRIYFLWRKLVKSLRVKAWNLIKESSSLSSSCSTLFNLYTFLLSSWKSSKITRTPYLWRKLIMRITMSVPPNADRMVPIVPESSSRIFSACRITFLSPSSPQHITFSYCDPNTFILQWFPENLTFLMPVFFWSPNFLEEWSWNQDGLSRIFSERLPLISVSHICSNLLGRLSACKPQGIFGRKALLNLQLCLRWNLCC